MLPEFETPSNWIDALSPPARAALRAAMISRTVKDGAEIFHQGDDRRILFEILEGHVAIVRLSTEGEETLMAIFGPGACVGEQGMIARHPRITGARACGPVRLAALNRAAFDRLRRDHPEITERLLEFVADRLRRTVALMAEHYCFSLRERLLRRLLILAQDCGHVALDGVEIDVRLSQETLAQWVGASRQRVNAALRSLQREGLIAWRSDKSVWVDSQAIAAALETASAQPSAAVPDRTSRNARQPLSSMESM
jgi:CRP-like cAMP-binding protein